MACSSTARVNSVFENDLSNGLLLCMRDRKGGVPDSKPGCEFSYFAMELNCGAPSRHSHHLAILPAHTVIPTCSQRLHSGFFCGKARCVTLHPVSLRVAIAHLAGGVDA